MNKYLLKIASMTSIVTAMGVAIASAAYDSTAFSTSTVVSNSNAMLTDIALILGGSIVAILSLSAALMGLGWAWRHLKSKITGKKF